VSSRDFSPAPYPFVAGNGTGKIITTARPPAHERYWLYALLFALTLLTATVVGAAMQSAFDRNMPFEIDESIGMYRWVWRHPAQLLSGLPFSITLLGILLAHEFGHYLAALYHRVDASLPYFLPSPFLGTFGAFIRVRSPIYSKCVLFDIGIAGPLAGFVLLLPALSLGMAFSKVIPGIAHQGSLQFGVPGLEWLLRQAIFPGVHAADLYLHPIARAAWIGMFATALNLLPIGQLDGGHILYSFFPRRHRVVSKVLCVLMLPLYRFWWGWVFWAFVLLLLGRNHPIVHDPAELTPGRRKLGWVALAVFLLCFTLDPIRAGGL
jgi:membrane-associated protease RseP (regulator of RpoE activity)